jgi:hypothetical protein
MRHVSAFITAVSQSYSDAQLQTAGGYYCGSTCTYARYFACLSFQRCCEQKLRVMSGGGEP